MRVPSSWARGLRLMRGNLLILSVTRVLGTFGRGMAFPYASLYILALGGEPAQIGLVNSLAPLAGLVAFPIAGYLADHAGRVRMIGLTGVFAGFVFLLYVAAPTWQWLVLGAILRGLTVIQFPPTSSLVVDSVAAEDRGRGIAMMNAVASAPAMFAPYVAGALLDSAGVNVGMRYLYGFLALSYVISALINLRFLQETVRRTDNAFSLRQMPKAIVDAYRGIPDTVRRFSGSIRAFAVVILLVFVANALAGPFWVVYAVDHIGLTSSEWGSILLIETALRNLAYVPAGLLVDRYGRARGMFAALLMTLVATPLFVLAKGFWAVLAIRAVTGMASALFTPSSVALLADSVPREMRGRVMAAIGRGSAMLASTGGGTGGPGLGFLMVVPVTIASFSAGYLYAYRPAFPWYLSFVALAIGAVVAARYVRDPEIAHE